MDRTVRLNGIFNSRVALILILVLAAILRLYNLDFQSPWLDEIHTLNESNPNHSISELYAHITRAEQLPPLYFYVLYFIFKVFGYSIVVARAVSALLGIVSVYAFYLLVKELIGKKTALIAALLIALNYYMIFYSQEARPYTLFVLFTILSYYKMAVFIKNHSVKNAVWFGVFTCLMLHSHVVGFFVLFAQVITLLIYFLLKEGVDRKLLFRRGILAAGVLLVLYLPALDSFLNLFQIKSFWIKPPTADALALIYNDFFGKSEIILFFNLVFFLGFMYWLTKSKQDQKTEKLSSQWISILIILWISLSILIPIIRTYVSVPMILGRYFIAVLPAILILLAIGVSKLKSKLITFTLVSLYTIYSLVHLVLIKDYYSTVTKAQFRELTTYIMERNADNDDVVTSLPQYIPYFFQKENKEYTIIGSSLDEFVNKQIQDKLPKQSFWYFDAHGREFTASTETLNFLSKNYIITDSYSGFQAWTRHYVIKDETNMKFEFSPEDFKRLTATNKIKTSIEKFIVDQNRLNASGWAMLENVDSKNTKLTVMLLNEQTGYVIESINKKRPDVTNFFKLDYNADHSGFEINTSLDQLPKGKYKLIFWLKNETENKESLVITNKEISLQ